MAPLKTKPGTKNTSKAKTDLKLPPKGIPVANNSKIDSQKTLGGDPECPLCQNQCLNGQQALQCDHCLQWVHAECDGYTEAEYALAKKKKSLKYYCQKCESVKAGEGKQNMNTNNDLQKQLTKLTEIMEAMSDRMKRMEETQHSDKDIEKKIEEIVNAKVEDALKEAQEKQHRKLNLVLVNIRESANPNPAEAREEDKKRVQALLEDIIPEGERVNLNISNPIRLGRQNIGRDPRRLRITVADESAKRVILKNSNKINKPGMTLKEKIWINADLTEKERKENKELRDLLKRKTAEGGPWKINYRSKKVEPAPPLQEGGSTQED